MGSSWQDAVVLITSRADDNSAYGTGFVIHRDEQGAYVLTCTHVINDVGGTELAKVNDIPATVIASGPADDVDVVVLRVAGLVDKPLLLPHANCKRGVTFDFAGYYHLDDNPKKKLVFRRLRGILSDAIQAGMTSSTLTIVWEMEITSNDELRPGNSGSPVVDEHNHVIGIVNTRLNSNKKRGWVTPIETLEKIWPEMFPSLFKQRIDDSFNTERVRLVDIHLKNIVAQTKQLPLGYLPGDFASGLEIDDVYLLPRLSKEHYRVIIEDDWLERKSLRQFNQSQEKEESRRPVLKAEKSSYSSLYEVVQSGADATLLGYMGSGKSMAASYIALQLAKGEGQSIFGLARAKIPILLRLGEIRETPASDLITFAIEDAIANLDDAKTLKDILRQEWNAGNVLLILDALDEFRGNMKWISEQIEQLVHRDLHGSSVLLTSRPSVYRLVSGRLVGLKAFTLEELQKEEISKFVEKWTIAILKSSKRNDVDPKEHVKSLTRGIEHHSFVKKEIASNQLLLTVLIILSFHPGGIRLERVTEAGLLDAYVTYLIDWEKSKGAEAPEKYGTNLLRIVFAYTGFEVQRTQSGMFDGICTKPTLLKILSASKYLKSLDSSGVTAEAILEFWLNTGLIQQADDVARSIRFRHQAFQYFGAALALTYQSEELVARILADVNPSQNQEWKDIRRLYLGLCAHPPPILE